MAESTACSPHASKWALDEWYLYPLSHMFLPFLLYFVLSRRIPAVMRISLVFMLTALFEVLEMAVVNTLGNYTLFKDIEDMTSPYAREDPTGIIFDLWFGFFGALTAALVVDGFGVEPWDIVGGGGSWGQAVAFCAVFLVYGIAHSVGSGYSRMCNTTRNRGTCDTCTGTPYVDANGLWYMAVSLLAFLVVCVLWFGVPPAHIPLFMGIYALFATACSLQLFSNMLQVQVLTAGIAVLAVAAIAARRFRAPQRDAPWLDAAGFRAPMQQWWV